MGMLDIEERVANMDELMRLLIERENLVYGLLFRDVIRVVTDKNLPTLIKESLSKAFSPSLSKYKEREVISLDCRTLKKGDAYGWMVSLSKKVKENPNLIVIIENITEIPYGPHCEDPQDIENLLGHSWRNDSIYFGDYHIDKTKLTVILTASPDNSEELGLKYRTDSYAWFPNFDKEWDELQQEIDKVR